MVDCCVWDRSSCCLRSACARSSAAGDSGASKKTVSVLLMPVGLAGVSCTFSPLGLLPLPPEPLACGVLSDAISVVMEGSTLSWLGTARNGEWREECYCNHIASMICLRLSACLETRGRKIK